MGLRAVAAAGLGLAMLLSWWGQVDEARAPDILPETGFGSPVALGRTSLTPIALALTDGKLILTARAENVTGESQTAVFGTPPTPPVMAIGGTALPAPEVTLLRDGTPVYQLQPRLPETVLLAWPAPPGWQPGPVEITFSRQAFKLRDNLYGQSSWLGLAPAAVLKAAPQVTP